MLLFGFEITTVTQTYSQFFRYRLIPILLGLPFLPIGLFVYGWTTQYKVHWIVPIIFTGFTGVGHIFAMVRRYPNHVLILLSDLLKLPTQVYMVDAFSDYAASALAATGVMRSIMGGTLPLAGLPLYSALGYGWVRVFVTLHLCCHYLLVLG
jgi:hypothetical protein